MMINFDLECDGSGGIVFVDKDRISTLSKEFGSILNIVVDVDGETGLVFDYPDDDWVDVWSLELDKLNKLCIDGLMFIGLLKDGEYTVALDVTTEPAQNTLEGFVTVDGTSLVIVEAGELIQSVIYPELPLEIVAELDLDKGNYSVVCNMVSDDGIEVLISQTENKTNSKNVRVMGA